VFYEETKEGERLFFLSFFSLMNTRSVFYEKTKKGNLISSLSGYKEAKIIRLQN